MVRRFDTNGKRRGRRRRDVGRKSGSEGVPQCSSSLRIGSLRLTFLDGSQSILIGTGVRVS